MGRFIIKIQEEYFIWSTVVDAPITYGMTKEELEENIRLEYGQSGLDSLPDRLSRVEMTGVSAVGGMTLHDLIAGNRAGNHEQPLTLDEIYRKYRRSAPWVGQTCACGQPAEWPSRAEDEYYCQDCWEKNQ